jgi:glycosyltransferase involved in cell wall biosynthesis
VVVVPSFDEGLSLPVIEALRAGAPVVASDIPAHRELLGSGSFLADPASPRDLARAVRTTRGSARTRSRQLGHLTRHRHEALEEAVTRPLRGLAAPSTPLAWPDRPSAPEGLRLSVGVAAPWPPQRTGVADFTAATVIELARLADVTVYTTADADVAAGLPADVRIEQRRVDELMAGGHDHDVLVSVVGNSHFHLPFIQLVQQHDCVVITHDTRLVELYLALRDRGGLQQVMLRGKDRRVLTPSLDDQIEDMRLLQSTAFWEVARRSQLLIGHTPTAAEFMHADTGVPLTLLPFANYRRPQDDVITDEMRRAARTRLGFDDGLVHLASFGFIDTRTKQSDVVVEAAAWLSQWGRRVSLHLVGSAPESLREELTVRAAEAGIEEFDITGFVDDDRFRDYVLGIDLGIQLRVSPLLGVSGPLSDMAAYGTPAVANRGICTDVDTPDFIDRLPDDVSPVMVAEAIDRRLGNPWDPSFVERMRVEYLAAKHPSRYAAQLLELLETVAQRGES